MKESRNIAITIADPVIMAMSLRLRRLRRIYVRNPPTAINNTKYEVFPKEPYRLSENGVTV
jgi:hypothetical protein